MPDSVGKCNGDPTSPSANTERTDHTVLTVSGQGDTVPKLRDHMPLHMQSGMTVRGGVCAPKENLKNLLLHMQSGMTITWGREQKKYFFSLTKK